MEVVGASWAAQAWCIREKIDVGPGRRDREVGMNKQCVHKDDEGKQCTELVETGLFCETHSPEGSKAKPRRGGRPGPGWGMSGNTGSSLLRYMGAVFQRGPSDDND